LNKSEINKINRVQLGRIRARPRYTVRGTAHAHSTCAARGHAGARPMATRRGLRSLGRPRPAQRARPACKRAARTACARVHTVALPGGGLAPAHRRRRGGGSPAWRRRRDGDERRATTMATWLGQRRSGRRLSGWRRVERGGR
jgi:hypothetical protein